MSLAIVHSRAQVGVEAPPVTVEAHLANGLPALTLVGLPETAVKESVIACAARSRTPVSISRHGASPQPGPADLPWMVGVSTWPSPRRAGASDRFRRRPLNELECLGELALSGELRPVQGVLPAALAACAAGRTLVVPGQCRGSQPGLGPQGAMPSTTCCRSPPTSTAHTPDALSGQWPAAPGSGLPRPGRCPGPAGAKRALLIAASGGHNLLLSGPPGTGKTLLASRLPGLLPPLSEEGGAGRWRPSIR